VLIASAEEGSVNPRLGTYSIRMADGEGDLIALMQGTVYRKQDKVEDLFRTR
jgi:acyl-CoA thioesterase